MLQARYRPRPVSSRGVAPSSPIMPSTACGLTFSSLAASGTEISGLDRSRSTNAGSREVDRHPFSCTPKTSRASVSRSRSLCPRSAAAALQFLDRCGCPVFLKEAEKRAAENDRQDDGGVHPLL